MGVGEKSQIIDGTSGTPGDALIGIASSGPHSNGYSLIRRIIQERGAHLGDPFAEGNLADALIAPTRLYVKPLLRLIGSLPVHALAHITGGGLPGNVPRVLPAGTRAVINRRAWKRPAIFDWLQEGGNVANEEMYRAFNFGVGMMVTVSAADAPEAVRILEEGGEKAFVIGHVEAHSGDSELVIVE